MLAGRPAVRTDTPTPRKPRSTPFLFPTTATTATRKRTDSTPVHQRRPQQSDTAMHSTLSPSKAIVFQRTHTPIVENTTLPEETLRALRQTRSLFLCCRNLYSFSHIRHLEHMTQLSSLNVHMNAISRIECLGHLQQLTELDVSANELRAVDDDAFKGLRHLKRLNLSSNFLTVVNGFQHLPALEWLSLSFNELEDIRGLRRLPCPQQLLHLDICGNKLADIEEMEKSLENCRELQDLRVETPKTALVLPAAPAQLHLRENPFCITEPNYAERLVQRFQRLAVLNGITCGYDPAAMDIRRREHMSVNNGEGDEQRRHCDPIDITYLVNNDNSNFSSSQQQQKHQQKRCRRPQIETDTCEAYSMTVAPANVSCGTENMTSTSTSTTGQSSSDSFIYSNHRKETPERHAASPAWRAKRVSRSVLTKVSIPLHKDLHVSAVEDGVIQEELHAKDELIEHLEIKLNRSQEQLSLRVALEEDLRRSFEDLRQTHSVLVDSSTAEKKRLSRQVTALKDELSRRSEEAVILQRKNRAELQEQAKTLRDDLQRQKKETATAVKKLEEELARVRREASNEISELKLRLEDAAQQNESLEKQNENAQMQLKKWRNELHSSKTSLLACETEIQFMKKSQHLQMAESLARRQLEFVAWGSLLTTTAAQVHLLQCENESLELRQENNQKAWEEYTKSLQQHYREALLQAETAKRLPPKGIDVGCDPVSELLQPETAKEENNKEEEEEEMQRLQTALSLTRQSEQLLSVENERLLRSLADKERELTEASQQLQQSESSARKVKDELQRERDNLLRTLHNLRETLQKRDTEFDDMEAEAKQKIDEKRATITSLETRLDEAEDEVANHRREAAKFRGVQEELKRVTAELQLLRQERAVSAAALPPPPSPNVKEMEGALEETKKKLSFSVVQVQQQTLKLSRAAEALTLLRGQLARVDEDNSRLRKELDEKIASLRASEAEKDRLQAQWRESQESARARQRATLQAISQMMVGDTESAA